MHASSCRSLSTLPYLGFLAALLLPVTVGPYAGEHAFLALQVAHPDALVRVTLEPASGADAPTGPLVFDHPTVP